MPVALNPSVSEPLLPSHHRRPCLGAIRTQYPFVSGLLGQLDQFAHEQASAAKRFVDLQDYVKECLLGRPSATAARKDPAAPDNLRLCAHRPFPLAGHSISDRLRDNAAADALRQRNRQILELLSENEGLRTQLASARLEAEQQASDAHRARIDAERASRLESEASAAKATEVLVQQNLRLSEARDALESKLAAARADSEAWKERAQSVQDMQEVVISAFERCNALDAENEGLKQAMHAFAEGSTSATVQELQTIITNLTTEVAQYKRRELDLKAKEIVLRGKENNSIIRAMRKQTRELKRRSLQAKNIEIGAQENAARSTPTFTVQVTIPENPSLPAIPSFSELFLM